MASDKIYGERWCKHCVIRICRNNVKTRQLSLFSCHVILLRLTIGAHNTDAYNVYRRFYCVIRSCDIKRESIFLSLFPLLAFSERNRGESVSSRVIADVSKERNYAASATQRIGPPPPVCYERDTGKYCILMRK